MDKEIDWQVNRSLLECNKYLLQTKVNCDVSFKVGHDQEVIKAHNFILSSRSPVFERMLNGSFCESETDPVIPDVNPAAFRTLLRYCYYECLNIEGDTALSVLYAAMKYMLPILERAARKTLIEKVKSSNIWEVCKYSTDVGDEEVYAGCMTYLKGHLSSSNILEVIEYAATSGDKGLHDYCREHCKDNLSESNMLDVTRYAVGTGDEELHATCEVYLKENLSGSNIWEVYKYALKEGDTGVHQHCREYFERDVTIVRKALQSEGFLNIQHKVLLDVLHINDKVDKAVGIGFTPGISISEIKLFKACNAWADAECLRQEINLTGANKRKVLGECLSLIRFPTMLHKDLLTIVYPTGLLTQAQIANLGQYINRDPADECLINFPSGKRQFVVTASVGPPGSTTSTCTSTVYVQSEVRIMLARLWLFVPGCYTVTVRNEKSHRSWITVLDSKHQNHVQESKDKVLHYIDIEQILIAGVRYSVTAERTTDHTSIKKKSGVEYVTVPENLVPYKEIKITVEHSSTRRFYGFTLFLV